MDHNNKHLLPGFQFPAAFAGLQNAGTNSLISTLSQFGLSTPMLNPISATDLAQWAAVQQSTQQAWLDTANLLPSFYLAANAKQLELAQQNLQSAVNGTTSSAIFPALMSQVAATKIISPPKEVAESPCAEPLSNASSSHQSSSTPQEIDVGVISTTSQTHAFDLSTKSASPAATITEPPLLCEPSTSTASSIITSTITPKLITSSLVPTSLSNNAVEDIDPAELLAPLFPHIILPTTTSELPTTSGGAGLTSLLATSSLSLPTVAASTVPPAGIVPKRSAAQEVEDADEHPEFGQMFDLEKEETGTVFGSNDGCLSPVQFTPPESPTHKVEEEEPPPCVNPFSARPTPSSTPFIPAPAPTPAPPPISEKKPPEAEPFKLPTPSPVKPVRKEPFPMRPINKANKVPIYKQKKSAVYKTDDKQEKNDDCGDAYSFSDEEEHSITKIDPKEKLEAEVREKLSKYAGQAADAKNKNVYVPGVGFAVPQEQPQQDLWRNVVLKKRPMIENRPIVPSANLLPASVHAEACQVAARLAEPEIVTLAESIRRRKKARYACPFIKTEPTTSTDCVKEEGADERMAEMQKEIESQPKLPKLVIKLPPKKSDEYKEQKEHKKKKKKKRRREEDDSDWEGSRKTKKHKKRRISESRRYSGGYDTRFDESEDIKPCLEDIKDIKPVVKEPEVPIFFKKKRLLEWQEGQNLKLENGERKYNGINGTTAIRKHSFADFNADAIKQRLSKFSQADGNITKGTFVVNKSELFRDDCALWKVDNPNMLQKFPPRIDPTTKNVSYKSSSTYSGWCEQISSGYYKVMVKFIKQTRSECIVEPDIPISDLFPAMTSECSDNNGIMQPEEELPADPNEHVNILRDQRRMDLHFIMRVMVDHALTLESIQAVKEKNDWTSIKALDFVTKLNSDCLDRIRQNSTMKEDIEDVLKEYHKLFIADMDSNGFICKVCQACRYEKRPVEKVIQLIGRQGYDFETLQPKDRPRICSDEEDDEPLAAQEIYLCGSCAVAAQYFHRCHHMLFHLLMACEDKLEMLGTLHAEYKPELIVELAKKARTWQSKLFSDILEMWKKIETMPVATVSAPPAPLVA